MHGSGPMTLPMRNRATVTSGTLIALAYAVMAPACGVAPTNSGYANQDADGGLFDEAGDPIFGDGGGASKPGCVGIQCQQVTCAAGQDTTVSGTVFAPNGTLALYNVIAYIPNAPLAPMTQGTSCDQCGGQVSGNPVVTALSDARGNFVLKNVPVGTNIPLVLQVGKWRRQVVIPEVKACVETKLGDPNLTRLPRNQGEGDLPKIALTTGSADPLGCILPKIGIDASEFSQGPGKARVNVYEGNGGTNAPSATAFWSDPNQLKAYDLVILSCEGDERLETKPAAALSAMEAYTNMGGRIFGSHYHYVWFQYGSPNFRGTAKWQGDGNADDTGGPYKVDTSFPKGMAFADWLVAVGASTTPGQVGLNDTKSDVGQVNTPSQRWITDSAQASTKYLTFNTPVGVAPALQCGKAVFGDMHISVSGGGSSPSVVDDSFPAGCNTTLSPQEKALAFLLYDLSSCIQPEGAPPVPPAPK